ncbi:unnamed protein product [Didymodactylos carnosus]|uniref:Uncharacterized protein n=1 Tax=Didymodactylos carnosus TaxID=1234261 RepID=A0A814E7H8_9BILA|nr:unnamed protein product [Didymodactylos carnosus]CAF3739249.1 unnamed protein product [Didymodactylos carnosus]
MHAINTLYTHSLAILLVMAKQFSKEFKQFAYRVIDFVEKEKAGVIIPLNNVNHRLQAILGISDRSIYYLKAEMKQSVAMQEDESGTRRSLRRTVSASSSSSAIPRALSTLSGAGGGGRRRITLTETQSDTIRLTFHMLLKDRVYPTLENILSALLAQDEHFPIKSKMSLQREMKRLGFRHQQTKKAPVLMNATPFQAQSAIYFRKLEELRSFGY